MRIFMSNATENAEHFPSNVRNAKHSVVANEYTRNTRVRSKRIYEESPKANPKYCRGQFRTIYFVTSNRGKYSEAAEKLSRLGIDVVQKNIGYPELQAEAPEEVVKFGLHTVKLNSPFIIEDSGLFVKALKDFPGVYSSFVYKTIGCSGILKLMKDVREREARFVSVIGLKFKDKYKIFKGECSGKISEDILGKGGFGYDPIFIPEGEKKTFAEMSIEEKNRYSHRGKAVEKLAGYLQSLL